MIVPRAEIDVSAVAAHYDELDDLYRSLWGTHLHHGYWITGQESSQEAVANLTRLVAERVGIRPGDRVCDLGCGYGAVALAFNDHYGARVTGLTISDKQYRYASAAAAENAGVEFFLRDALRNALPSCSFDTVIAIESSEHMPDKAQFFAEAYRLLRPGGHCVAVAWLSRDQPAPWECKYLLEPICKEGRLPSMGSAGEYRTMLEQAGFVGVECADLTHRVKKTWTVCALRLARRALVDPALRRRLLDSRFTNRVFAKAVFRIRLAYEIGVMRYGLFFAEK